MDGAQMGTGLRKARSSCKTSPLKPKPGLSGPPSKSLNHEYISVLFNAIFDETSDFVEEGRSGIFFTFRRVHRFSDDLQHGGIGV
jgi:hypothetical protein